MSPALRPRRRYGLTDRWWRWCDAGQALGIECGAFFMKPLLMQGLGRCCVSLRQGVVVGRAWLQVVRGGVHHSGAGARHISKMIATPEYLASPCIFCTNCY